MIGLAAAAGVADRAGVAALERRTGPTGRARSMRCCRRHNADAALFTGCRPYATALANGEADINQCPPGGDATAAALAKLLGREPRPVDPRFGGVPAHPAVAWIDEARVHRLREMHSGVPGRCDRRRDPLHAHRHRRAMHRLRAVHPALPCRLHRHAAARRVPDRWLRPDVRGGLRLNAHKERSTAAALCVPPARSKHLCCRSINTPARPRCRWSSRVSGFCADSRSPSLAARSARGCIRLRRELSRQSSRGPRRIASARPRSASSLRTTAAMSATMRTHRRRRSISSRPSSCAKLIARGGIVGLGGAVFPTAAKLSSAVRSKRTCDCCSTAPSASPTSAATTC